MARWSALLWLLALAACPEASRDAPVRPPLLEGRAAEEPAGPAEEERREEPEGTEPARPQGEIPEESGAPQEPARAQAAAFAERREEREAMVRLVARVEEVRDPRVLAAMRRVPRHAFVPAAMRALAYENRPLPIGWDQTISQPQVVATMTDEARVGPDTRVLEIGTGSGYQAAILAELTPHVFSIEIREPLAQRAEGTLAELGYGRVRVRHGDGYHGWPEAAPFDVILVTAAASHVPPPLVRQLAPSGRMVIPVGSPFAVQDLQLVTKDEEGRVRTRSLFPVRFVPLLSPRGGGGEGAEEPGEDVGEGEEDAGESEGEPD